MARVGITEAAARLGLSVDSVRRRVRKGDLPSQRDNRGQWWVDVPDDAVPMPRQGDAMLAPAYAPMQQDQVLVDALGAQVADLAERLDRAGEQHEAERAAWQAERDRLLTLVETLAAREPAEPISATVAGLRAEAAEAQTAELRGLLDHDLAELRAMVEGLAKPKGAKQPEPPVTAEPGTFPLGRSGRQLNTEGPTWRAWLTRRLLRGRTVR